MLACERIASGEITYARVLLVGMAMATVHLGGRWVGVCYYWGGGGGGLLFVPRKAPILPSLRESRGPVGGRETETKIVLVGSRGGRAISPVALRSRLGDTCHVICRNRRPVSILSSDMNWTQTNEPV
jgi:hypothetical protein